MKKIKKVLIIICALSLSIPPIALATQVPTAHYRDVFFYADTFVYKEILFHGYLPESQALQSSTGGYLSTYWGKIFTRIKSPGFPILLAEYSMLTGASPSLFYVGFPGYLLPGLGFGVLAHFLFQRTGVTLFTGTVASLAPNVRPEYTMNINSANIFLTIISIYCLYKIVLGKESRAKTVRYSILFSLFSISLFYWYPSAFLTVGITAVLLLIGSRYISNSNGYQLLIPVGISGVIFLQIFAIPLSTYLHWFITAIVRISQGELLSVSSSGAQPATALPPSYYSAIGIIGLLPLGIIGGYITIRMFFNRTVSNRKVNYSLPTVAWGCAVLTLALFYLTSGSSWLLTRPVFFSLPVVILGGSIAVNHLSDRKIVYTLTIVCILLCASFALSTTTPLMQIQTYETETVEGGEWISQHGTGPVLGDTKQGSVIISNSYYEYFYPLDQEGLQSLYYTQSEQQFERYVDSKEGHLLIFSEQMSTTGLYATDYNHAPISEKSKAIRNQALSRVYDNGESTVLSND